MHKQMCMLHNLLCNMPCHYWPKYIKACQLCLSGFHGGSLHKKLCRREPLESKGLRHHDNRLLKKTAEGSTSIPIYQALAHFLKIIMLIGRHRHKSSFIMINLVFSVKKGLNIIIYWIYVLIWLHIQKNKFQREKSTSPLPFVSSCIRQIP